MSVDQALLESAQQNFQATLRTYRWSPATVSLGYFQAYPQGEAHPASGACPIVRRATGGGAIVHDHELTYSLCLPSTQSDPVDHRQMVEQVHSVFVQVLEEVGVSGCRLVESADVETTSEPYLCYLRRAVGDVELNGHKIIGSAQRRTKGAFLQHGSMLIGMSKFAPELLGIEDLSGVQISQSDFEQRWAVVLGQRIKKTIEIGQISTSERECAQRIQRDRFGSPKWQRKR